ncbi:DUF4136 domain-containing protein [uncultured Aquabacterium sp.]|jgi:hypothetical protein|uniref:DUF4136 domain-containing protein n=1 Tax=uncultured Aquabacterium sp. TaxID=158753 RepID=UPI002604A44B|nr:DUF4136 domain-containing protein [uncultured Aquabacterium sp.]
MTTARTTRFSALRWLTGGLLCVAMLALQGCAALNEVRTEVQTFGDWPATRSPGPYVFDRLPSQANAADQIGQLEAAAAPALASHGFTLASGPDQAVYTVQLTASTRVTPRYDPFWGGAPYWYHPWGRPGVGGWWGTGGGGLALSYRMEQPYVEMLVGVVVRDRRTHAVLHEARASLGRLGSADPALYAPLFDAALKDFPLTLGPRTVIVPLQPAP